jgi:hypothetical protein
MRNNLLLLAFLVGSSFSVFAQPDSTASKISYFNSFHAGGLFGKKGSGSGESFSTIHGIRFKRFAFGIGVGYDAYQEWRTLPVFASVTYDFLKLRDNAFFIQINAGYSKAWYPLEEEDQFTYDRKRGPCAHPLIGYRIHSNKFDLYLTAGYKFQGINYLQTPRWWNWAPGSKITVGRDIERISIQLGFGFH